jgi:cytochrome c peroxidase
MLGKEVLMERKTALTFLFLLIGIGLLWTSAFALTPMEQLGKDLFFDANLSTPAGVACAACHAPNTAFAGPRSDLNAHGSVYPGAVHTRFGNRKPPTAAYASFSPDFHYDPVEELYVGGMFWDGRALNTVEQAKGPFLNPLEMNDPNPRSVILKVLRSDYAPLFWEVYGSWSMAGVVIPPDAVPELPTVGSANFIADAYQFIAEAIAAYEASSEVNRFSSKYDAYLAGNATLTADELWGLQLFEGEAGCDACHPSEPGPNGEPPLFTDFTYDNLGVPKNPENPFYSMPPGFNPAGEDWVDPGLGGFLGNEDELGKMKVPTLRNVGMRPYPGFVQAYGHNGYFKSLLDIVHFYNTRDVEDWPPPEVPENVNHDELGDLGLSPGEEAALVTFMNTLTDGWMDGSAQPGVSPAVSATPVARLLGNAPNPFRAATTIRFVLDREGPVNLGVFDLSGRRVASLLTNVQGAGEHRVIWDGRDAAGREVVPGVYFYRLETSAGVRAQRMLRLP